MKILKNLSLRAIVVLVASCIIILGFAITITVITSKASSTQMATATNYANELAKREGLSATQNLRQALETARTLAAALNVISNSDDPSRDLADSILIDALMQNQNYLGVWAAWEPNAFDDNDEEFKNTKNSDNTGRYLAQFSLEGTQVQQGVLVDYDKSGAGDYYQVPKSSNKNALLEPYIYDFGNREVLLTTISVPIMRDGKFVGAAGVDISLDQIKDLVENIKLYDTGYASLVSTDGVLVGDKFADSVGKNIAEMASVRGLNTKEIIDNTVNSNEVVMHTYNNGLKTQVTLIQVPIFIEGIDRAWSFIITLPNNEILRDITTLQMYAIALGIGSILLTCLGLLWVINYFVIRPLGGDPAAANELVSYISQGDLSHDISLKNNDNHSLAFGLHSMQENLTSIIKQVTSGSHNIVTSASQIEAGNLDLSSRTEEQSSSLAETAASMEQITATVRQNADNAQQASSLAKEASTSAQSGSQVVSDLVATMNDVDEKSQQINSIIEIIDSIAFQTNILALNAAVEAARAGEQGRGFAVVASEVRSLAQRSASSANEIRDLIQSSADTIKIGSEQANKAHTSIQEIVIGASKVNDIMDEITTASREQTSGIEQINIAINQMDDITRQNASLVEESAAAASSLREQADVLQELMTFFKLDQDQDYIENQSFNKNHMSQHNIRLIN